jgi:hypothetical protein
MPGKTNKRSKRRDERPARTRYWQKHQLRTHKVHNLMRCCGMTQEDATKLWTDTRKRRMK